MSYSYAMCFGPGELCSPTAREQIIKEGQQVFWLHHTFRRRRVGVRKDLGNTFVAGGTSRSGGLLLLGTLSRSCAYCSLQQEFSSPENEEDMSLDGMQATLGWGWGGGAPRTTKSRFINLSPECLHCGIQWQVSSSRTGCSV